MNAANQSDSNPTDVVQRRPFETAVFSASRPVDSFAVTAEAQDVNEGSPLLIGTPATMPAHSHANGEQPRSEMTATLSASERFPMPFVLEYGDPEGFLKIDVQGAFGQKYTGQWCIDRARELLGGVDFVIAPYQGSNSFSLVMDRTEFVQFRLSGTSSVMVQTAHQLYPEWVPAQVTLDDPPFELHSSPLIRGIPLVQYGGFYDDTGAEPGLVDRVRTLGTIIGRSTFKPAVTDASIIAFLDDELAKITAPEYQRHTSVIRADLSLLQVLPTVLTHTDLLPHNILVDPDTAQVTGIVDWVDAKMLPLGSDIWALDMLLAVQTPERWSWKENKAQMEEVFWDEMWKAISPDLRGRKNDTRFRQALKMAKDVGLLLRFAAPELRVDWRSIRRVDSIITQGACNGYFAGTDM